MADIVLATLNAKYIHAAFGLRYLLANLGELRERACIVEFDLNQRPSDVAEILLARNPRIIGLGVYIWNAQLSAELVQVLKSVAPEVQVIIGGPEVSYECDGQAICRQADYVITGEADLKFAEVCRELLAGRAPAQKIIPSELPDLARLEFPYRFYTDADIASRIVYVEASRGCPFTCEFCLSSLDVPVRAFALDRFLAEMGLLHERGVRHFKFVDRTFNLSIPTSKAILEFFLARLTPDLFLHFEMVPDRLPDALREVIGRFPAGVLQFEVGIQTFNPEVGARIKRRQNYDRLAENFQYLRSHTGVHIHADLIVGLPGETMESFGEGFDRLVAMGPQEIQVGILKRLRGTPIVRHDEEWQMVYSPFPPYELLRSRALSFEQMQEMRRFGRHWDLLVNSGNFVRSAPLIWQGQVSAFWAFMRWSRWLFARIGRNHGIALGDLAEHLFDYLTGELGQPAPEVARTIYSDYLRGGRNDKPKFLRPYIEDESSVLAAASAGRAKRQARHLAA